MRQPLNHDLPEVEIIKMSGSTAEPDLPINPFFLGDKKGRSPRRPNGLLVMTG